MIEGVYESVVTHEFIERRDAIIAGILKKGKDTKLDLIRRYNCEWPEHHQATIDPNQTLYEGNQYDTIHTKLGNCDYKQYAKIGIHIGKFIQKQVNNNKIDNFVIWKWYPNNWSVTLEENKNVTYEIIGVINAKFALKFLDHGDRFPYEEVMEWKSLQSMSLENVLNSN